MTKETESATKRLNRDVWDKIWLRVYKKCKLKMTNKIRTRIGTQNLAWERIYFARVGGRVFVAIEDPERILDDSSSK